MGSDFEFFNFLFRFVKASDVFSLKNPLKFGHDDRNVLLATPADDGVGDESFLFLEFSDFLAELVLSGLEFPLEGFEIIF